MGVWIKGLEGFEPKGSLGAAFFLGIGDDGLSHRGPFGHKLSNELWSRLLLFFFLPCRISISNFRICHCLDFTREVTLLLINEPDIRTIEYGEDAVEIQLHRSPWPDTRTKVLESRPAQQDPSSVSLEIPTAPPLTAWSHPAVLSLARAGYEKGKKKRKERKKSDGQIFCTIFTA